jgi:hypothetical protein
MVEWNKQELRLETGTQGQELNLLLKKRVLAVSWFAPPPFLVCTLVSQLASLRWT